MTKISPTEAKDALKATRDTMASVMATQKHLQALHLTLDDAVPAYCVEKIAAILSALAGLELRLRGVAGSGELQRVKQDTPQESPIAKHRPGVFVPPKDPKR